MKRHVLIGLLLAGCSGTSAEPRAGVLTLTRMDEASGIAGSFESADGLRLELWSATSGEQSVAEIRNAGKVVVSVQLDDGVSLLLDGENPLAASTSPEEVEARLADFGATRLGGAVIGLGRALDALELDPAVKEHTAPLVGLASVLTVSSAPDVTDAQAGLITGDGFDCGAHSDRPCRTCGITQGQCKFCCPRWYWSWSVAYYFCFLNCEACDTLNHMPGGCN